MIGAQLPILQVLLPLLGAVFCVLVRTPGAAWGVHWVTLLGTCAVALALFLGTPAEGLRYALGDWSPPLGISYVPDPLNSALLLLVSACALAVAPAARRLLAAELAPPRIPLYYACLLLNLSGLLGVLITGDIFNMFVFIEIASLSSYVLVALGPDRAAPFAAFRYLVTGTLGATFFLIGIGYLYALTGTLNLADLAERLPETAATRTLVMAFAFITLGTAAKFALFPLHAWLPAVYQRAPAACVAFLAATAGKVYIYAWLRIAYGVFGAGTEFPWQVLQPLVITAAVGLLFGSVLALRQRGLRGLLACSSIAQTGYIMLGLSLGTLSGITAGLLHLVHHALVKGSLFMAAAGFLQGAGGTGTAQLRGAARDMPWSFATVLAAALALFGFPFSSGFLSKWMLLLALVERGSWVLVATVLGGSLLGAAYCWKLLRLMLERDPAAASAPSEPRRRDPPAATLIACWLLLLPAWVMGLYGATVAAWARRAAAVLIPA